MENASPFAVSAPTSGEIANAAATAAAHPADAPSRRTAAHTSATNASSIAPARTRIQSTSPGTAPRAWSQINSGGRSTQWCP